MNDRTFLSTWEQQVEYHKVKDWGRDFNLTHGLRVKPNAYFPLPSDTFAEDLINNIQGGEV